MSSRAPLIPSNCEPEWGHLLERCWEPIPMNRCSLRDLAESLQRIIDEIEVEQQVSITHACCLCVSVRQTAAALLEAGCNAMP